MKIELCCTKKHNATNICHHNLKIDGEKFRLIDPGCDFTKTDIKKMAADKDIFFEKDWVIGCDLGEADCELL